MSQWFYGHNNNNYNGDMDQQQCNESWESVHYYQNVGFLQRL